MKGINWQSNWVRGITTALTVGMMVLIFFFSTQTAERSDKTSGRVAQIVIDVLHPDFSSYGEEEQESIYNATQHIVRKAAHFSEYTALGLLALFCLESWRGKKKWNGGLGWAAGTLYAMTDEIHQLLIDGRSGQWTDVLIDSSGVLTGVLLAWLILRRINPGEKEGD